MLSPEQVDLLSEWFVWCCENPGEAIPDSLTEMGDVLETGEDDLITLYELVRFGAPDDD